MMWTEKNIFEPSGCLTRGAFVALQRDELPFKAKNAAETHLSACPFCTDAFEGYISNPEKYNTVLAEVDNSFAQKYPQKSSRSGGRKIWLTTIAAAASILLFISIFFIHKPDLKMEQVAMKPEMVSDTLIGENSKDSLMGGQLAMNSEPKQKEEVKIAKQVPVKTQINEPDVVVEKELSLEVSPQIESMDEMIVPPVEKTPIVADSFYTVNSDKEQPEEITQEFAYADERRNSAPAYKKEVAMKSRSVKQDEAAPASAAGLSIQQDRQPIFNYKGFTDFAKYIESQLPVITDTININKVTVAVSIDKKGFIAGAIVTQGINPKIDSTVLEKVKKSPKWIPAKRGGEAVYSTIIVTIRIRK